MGVIRAEPVRVTDWAAKSVGAAWRAFDGGRVEVKAHIDANDVVVSWSAGIDAENPLHVGNTGAFEYYTYLWSQLINAPAS